MDDSLPDPARQRGRGLSTTLLVVGALGVTGAAAWLYYRTRQKGTDERTRDRLQPRVTHP